ncbi:MAG: ArdC-like ssDNA-binding domain-containing protein [Oscillospiraceae bacterium]
MKELTDKLKQGVRDVFESGQYAEYLKTVSKFHSYSFRNVILILIQYPEASRVAGFNTWKKLGRTIRKGEKGIAILAPVSFKKLVETAVYDPDTHAPVYDADGNPVKETQLVKKQSYKIVHVFDISQTEGRELPSIGVDELRGDVSGYDTILNAVTNIAPVPIHFRSGENISKGCYSHLERCIYINEGMSQVQTVKTAVHELAHSMLHDRRLAESPTKDRRTREVEAESIAYVVCQHFGIETSDYSFAYVTSWSQSEELDELTASLDCISSTAAAIIDGIEERCPELRPAMTEAIERAHKKHASARAQATEKMFCHETHFLARFDG